MIRMNLSKREKFIFIVTIITIVSAIGYNFILEPLLKQWTLLDNEIIVQKAKLRKDINLLGDRNTIIQEYNSYATSFKSMSKIFGYMKNQADILGIKISNIRPGQAIQRGIYKEYIIELQIEGTVSAINQFISELLKSPVFVTVQKFDFRTIPSSPSIFKGSLILSKLVI